MLLPRILLLAVALALASCAATISPAPPVTGAEAEQMSMVFGYIDMTGAPSNLTQVSMKHARKFGKDAYYGFGVKDGTFYRIDVPMGPYRFELFRGQTWSGGVVNYKFQGQGQGKLDPVIDKPGLYFVGSWRYKKEKSGFFEPDQFDIEPISSPSEREVLERVLTSAKLDKPTTCRGRNASSSASLN